MLRPEMKKQLHDIAHELVVVHLVDMLEGELACDVITGQCDEWLIDQIANLLEQAVEEYDPRAQFTDYDWACIGLDPERV